MKTTFKKLCTTVGMMFATSALVCASAQASVIGNLNDGLNHTATNTGYWSLFVNAGDNVTVTARRLEPTDIWAFATDGPDGTGTRIAAGDDQLSAFAGGPWGDPQFSFLAAMTGEFSVGVFRCCNSSNFEAINYFVNAQGATGQESGAVPEPTTIALFGLGLLGFAAARRKLTK